MKSLTLTQLETACREGRLELVTEPCEHRHVEARLPNSRRVQIFVESGTGKLAGRSEMGA